MSTTTIRMPDDLKKRVTRAAARAGTTPHAFMLDAIAGETDAQERQAAFEAVAAKRLAGLAGDGQAIGWNELRAYLEKRATGRRARRPAARKLTVKKS